MNRLNCGMHPQRLTILIASLVGIGTLFLPWSQLPFGAGEVNGLHGYGWIVFATCMVSALISLFGQKSGFLPRPWWLICMASGIISTITMVVFFVPDSSGIPTSYIRYGAYACGLACLALLAATVAFKSPRN